MRCHVVGGLGRPVRVDDRHGWKVLEPVPTEIWREGFAGGNQRSKSAQRAKGGRTWGWLKDFAQQRRHDLENSYPLARYLLHEERGVPRLFVGTDMDSRAYHEGRKKLPDGD